MFKIKIISFILLFYALALKVYSQPFNITATISYNGSRASGEYQVFRGYSNSNFTLANLRKPIVFVEGFDVSNTYNIPTLRDMLYSGSGLGSQLNNLGYDIIILNFNQGGDYIQKNAFLLVELIKQINIQKPNNEPLVVIGYSMGGLVARYALTYMEQHEAITGAHQARLFVSYDSPHKGAHIPVNIQALALSFDADAYKLMFPDLADAINQFTAPAAKQMLKYRLPQLTYNGPEVPISSDYITFMNELNSLNNCNGFPTKCRNIAFSLGSWNGVGQRSNLDLDNNGVKDLQHSGMPMLYLNIPRGTSGGGAIWIVNANPCQAIGAFSFQSFLSNAYSNKYPHFSQRSSYNNLGNYVYATYWYVNPNSSPLFPWGSWSRFWYYKDFAPADFAPGSFTPIYSTLSATFNAQVNCSFNIASNSTFISTVSALAFDTEDLFYNIAADPNRLEKTPFDAIYGISGDNTSHVSNPTSNYYIVSSLVSEISNDYGSCATNYQALSGIVNTGQSVTYSDISTIDVSNYKLKNGSNVSLVAGKTIVLKSGFNTEVGSKFTAKVIKCSKACNWSPAVPLRSSTVNDEDFINALSGEMNTRISISNINPINQNIDIYPNPTSDVLNISGTVHNQEIRITSLMGALKGTYLTQDVTTTIDLTEYDKGIYFVQYMDEIFKVIKK